MMLVTTDGMGVTSGKTIGLAGLGEPAARPKLQQEG